MNKYLKMHHKCSSHLENTNEHRRLKQALFFINYYKLIKVCDRRNTDIPNRAPAQDGARSWTLTDTPLQRQEKTRFRQESINI